jgi:hypothetical protein
MKKLTINAAMPAIVATSSAKSRRSVRSAQKTEKDGGEHVQQPSHLNTPSVNMAFGGPGEFRPMR